MRLKLFSIALVFAFLFCPCFVYCQQLDATEMSIYFDASEVSMRALAAGQEEPPMADVAAQHSLTEDKLEDIMMRGWQIPLSSQEQTVAEELKQKLSSPKGEKVTLADLDSMKQIAAERKMSFGQVCTIFVRMNSDLL